MKKSKLIKNNLEIIKKLLLFSIGLLLSVAIFAQKDSTWPKTITHPYIRITPYQLSTNSGFIDDRLAQNIEVGKSFGMVDLGMVVGRLTQRDTTNYIELKATMDASQYGIFSNEFSFGFGKVFHSTSPYLFETSTTMLAQVNKSYGIGLIVSDFYQTGNYTSTSNMYYGLFIRYGLLRTENGLLHKAHHHK